MRIICARENNLPSSKTFIPQHTHSFNQTAWTWEHLREVLINHLGKGLFYDLPPQHKFQLSFTHLLPLKFPISCFCGGVSVVIFCNYTIWPGNMTVGSLLPRSFFSELKQRRRRPRRRQREPQKSNRFRLAKQQLCMCTKLFCTFLSHRCTTAT